MFIKNYNKFLESKNQKTMWDIIPNSVKVLHKLFTANNKKLYVVGGAVRDFLNNEKPKDFDLCTDATPDEVIDILKDYKTNLQGRAFGVVVVFTDDQPEGMEIATFREDVYDTKLGKSRNPNSVNFTTIDKDVKRRDITYNAMFFDLDKKEIVDLVGGQEDIKNKITKFVGEPSERIIEDPLRILRILRFSCRYNFSIDEKTADAIKENADTLNIISKERIYDEMKKAWKQAKSYTTYLNYFIEFGLFEHIFPNALVNKEVKDCKFFVTYIANLFKNDKLSDLEKRLIQTYKFDSDVVSKALFLINLVNLSPDNAFNLFKMKNSSHCEDSVILDWFNINDLNDNMFIKFLEYTPSVSAEELMAKGIKGKELGDTIKRMESDNFKKLIEINEN